MGDGAGAGLPHVSPAVDATGVIYAVILHTHYQTILLSVSLFVSFFFVSLESIIPPLRLLLILSFPPTFYRCVFLVLFFFLVFYFPSVFFFLLFFYELFTKFRATC